jgi:hypothetical protein
LFGDVLMSKDFAVFFFFLNKQTKGFRVSTARWLIPSGGGAALEKSSAVAGLQPVEQT